MLKLNIREEEKLSNLEEAYSFPMGTHSVARRSKEQASSACFCSGTHLIKTGSSLSFYEASHNFSKVAWERRGERILIWKQFVSVQNAICKRRKNELMLNNYTKR